MNHRLRSLSLLLVLLSLFAATSALTAAEQPAFSIALQYTPGDRPAQTALVPRALVDGATIDIPISISDAKTWLVSFFVNDADGIISVLASDLANITPSGPATVLRANFKLASGKPVTLLKTTSGTLEATITKE